MFVGALADRHANVDKHVNLNRHAIVLRFKIFIERGDYFSLFTGMNTA